MGAVGFDLGLLVGFAVGFNVGFEVGLIVVGLAVGFDVGLLVVGLAVGLAVGLLFVGLLVGLAVGLAVGLGNTSTCTVKLTFVTLSLPAKVKKDVISKITPGMKSGSTASVALAAALLAFSSKEGSGHG